MLKKIKRLKDWILNKTPELKHLSMSDALLAKIVIDLKRESTSHGFKTVPLDSLALIHPINRETALEKVDLRAKAIREHRDGLIRDGHISNQSLEAIMPSVSPIQAIPFQGRYLAFEGNGRLAALQQAFSDNGAKDMTIEVEEFLIHNDSKIYLDIQKLQQIYAGGY